MISTHALPLYLILLNFLLSLICFNLYLLLSFDIYHIMRCKITAFLSPKSLLSIYIKRYSKLFQFRPDFNSRLAMEFLHQIRSSEWAQNGAGDDKISSSLVPPGAEPFPQALLSPMRGISAGLSLPLGLSMAASPALGESIASPIPEGTTRR